MLSETLQRTKKKIRKVQHEMDNRRLKKAGMDLLSTVEYEL